ncbi:MAG: EamA family transporter [Leptolyngbya sp. SIO1D8]|nr:EamA family transporter [Leptolyngbya sp. SIO1D8]
MLALISKVLTLGILFAGIKISGCSKALIFSTLEPLVTIVLMGIILQQSITHLQLIGGALILKVVITLARNRNLQQWPRKVQF